TATERQAGARSRLSCSWPERGDEGGGPPPKPSFLLQCHFDFRQISSRVLRNEYPDCLGLAAGRGEQKIVHAWSAQTERRLLRKVGCGSECLVSFRNCRVGWVHLKRGRSDRPLIELRNFGKGNARFTLKLAVDVDRVVAGGRGRDDIEPQRAVAGQLETHVMDSVAADGKRLASPSVVPVIGDPDIRIVKVTARLTRA